MTQRLSFEEGLRLFKEAPLEELKERAVEIRNRKMPPIERPSSSIPIRTTLIFAMRTALFALPARWSQGCLQKKR